MKKLDNRTFRIVIAVACVVFVLCMLFSYIGYGRTIIAEKEKNELLSKQYESLSNENEELKNYINEDETGIYERNARENGYVYPDEYVYIDGT